MGINISRQSVVGPCNLKCAYSFQYPNSSCTATNKGIQEGIDLSYDKTTIPPVTYNGNKYIVNGVNLSYNQGGFISFNETR